MEATQLASSIGNILDAGDIPDSSPLISIFGACQPVLRARIANLATAQNLVESQVESGTLRLTFN